MSDSLCGPSNALQNLQKHASADRTLQQDRLVSRQPSSQGFRSQSLNQGILDHEFAAFESNTVDTPVPNLQHAAIPFSARSSHHAIRSFAENQNWATDFQRLQISGPSHTIYQHRGPLAASASAVPQQGWQNEFLKQQQQPDPTPQWHQQGLHPAFASSHSFHAASVNAHPIAQEATSNQQPATQVFDESAFEAAFEQAKADMMSQDIGSTQDTIEESSDNTIQLDTSAVAEPGETIRIGSDTIPQTNKSDTQAHNNNADELARTAGHLLQSVSHDQSQKFKESNFLALMRRIRDREVHVEGDEFRETSQSLHPGGRYYPEGQQPTQQEITSGLADQRSYGHDTPPSRYPEHERPFIPAEVKSTKAETFNDELHYSGSVNGQGLGDGNSLHSSWAYGDRWA